MDYVNLGHSGLKVSQICLGTMSFGEAGAARPWAVDDATAAEIFTTALEAGINFFDTADTYADGNSELVLGKLLKRHLGREEAVVATKLHAQMTPGPNGGGLSAKHVHAAIDASLKRLELDYIDLYQIHRFDPQVPVEETMGALNQLVEAGKVRYLGASSMYAWQFAKMQLAAERAGGARFISMQNHYNLAYREEEREVIPQCVDMGVGVIPWSPLARGMLAGTRGLDGARQTERSRTDAFADMLYTDDDLAVVRAVHEVAEAKGVPMAQVAMAWLLGRRGVVAPIVGATKASHVTDAVAACSVELSREERQLLEAPYRPHAIAGHV